MTSASFLRCSLALAIATILAGCQSGPVRSAAQVTGFATTTPEPADFVKEKRPESTDYIPVGVAAPSRARIKTPEEIKAAESGLDSLRGSNEARGAAARAAGSTPAPEPAKTPAPTN